MSITQTFDEQYSMRFESFPVTETMPPTTSSSIALRIRTATTALDSAQNEWVGAEVASVDD